MGWVGDIFSLLDIFPKNAVVKRIPYILANLDHPRNLGRYNNFAKYLI